MLLMLGPANPFTTFDPPVGYDGPGPNPLLQNHILVAFHPPDALPRATSGSPSRSRSPIAALVTGRLGEGWLLETRRWTLFAWGFLTAGIVLGAWWAYDVLGWGGYWGWDPVENASLLPWLTGTAYLHSVLVQERRGMLRVWNLSLVCATFSLTILGTFITRSGVLASVHAFSEGGVGPWLLTFFAITVVVTVGLIFWRGDRLRAPGTHRLAAVARGRVPGQQPGVRGVRLHRVVGHGVPAHRRGAAEPAGLGRRAVLRADDGAGRDHAAVPHGRGAGVAVAQGQRRTARQAPRMAGVGCRRLAGVRRARRRSGSVPAARVHDGRLRSVGRVAAAGRWRRVARDGVASSDAPTAA